MLQMKRYGSPTNCEEHAKRKHSRTCVNADENPSVIGRYGITSQHGADFHVPSISEEDEIICYGALCEVQAQLLSEAQAKLRKPLPRNIEHHIGSIDLYRGEYAVRLHGLGPLALLDTATAIIMRQITKQPLVQTTAVLGASDLAKARSSGSKTCSFPLSINIFGPRSRSATLGEVLVQNAAFLQHPRWLQDGIRYMNPQYYPPDLDLTDYVGLSENDLKARLISNEVENLLASLDGDGVEDQLDLVDLKTTLKPHQRVALHFIAQRESQRYCRKLEAELRLLMNLPTVDKAMYPATGGILADVMGLGKTLTMLCTIVRTREQATNYRVSQSRFKTDDKSLCVTEATLVVVTSIQVLDVWTKELQTHFRDGTLNTISFHGQRRTKDPTKLTGQHLVLTTYGTLVADSKGPKVLEKMAWYRIILDEAHWISNFSSQSARAAKNLVAEKRWCITGTPVQNRLEDFVSLLKFLHLRPFDDPTIFRARVLEPLGRDTLNQCRNLKALLNAVCLRRSESYLGLPHPVHRTETVRLSSDEKQLYTAVLSHCKREIDEMVSGRSQRKRYMILFSTTMKLRRLCNHGTLSAEGESECDLCYNTEEDNLALLSGREFCPECSRSLRLAPSVESPFAPSPLGDVEMTDVTEGTVSASVDSTLNSGARSSSKIEAVLENLANSDHNSKSLVFSYWTTTLDLLRTRLEGLRLPCLQIDGRVGYSERRSILERFRRPEGPAILLMSIKTGAVGLNITAANRIHIVEPQWNPSVEQQAIARVLRMGQQRQVTIIRYIVEKTVEENIVALQKKKSRLAKFILDSASDDGMPGRLQDLNFVLDTSP